MEELVAQWGPASAQFWVRLVWALIVLVVMIRLAGLGRSSTRQAMLRTRAHPNATIFLAQVAQLAVLALGIAFALGILGVGLTTLTAFFGLATIALSLSVQDIARSLLAGLYLLIERPFNVGDWVEVGGQQGMVQDVRVRTTVLKNADGDLVIVPNLVMFTSTIVQKRHLPQGSQAVEGP